MEGLKPYPAYKESGLPWLGQVPAHWGTRRTKVLFRERVEKDFPDEPLLAATQSKGVVRKEDYGTRTVTAQKDFHLLKLVEVGDFVISLRSFQGGIEVAHYRGIISPAYTVLEPRSNASSGYFRHFFKSPDFISSLTLFVTGIREGQNIDYERLSRAFIPLPPTEEQTAIVRFLDHGTHQLDKAIRAKRKTIALLNEQKQAIIHRAVTRGSDPDVPLKDSGIPWLGQIPAHWEVRRVGLMAAVFNGTTPSRAQPAYWSDGTIPWVASGKVNDQIIETPSEMISERALRECSLSLAPQGSIVMGIVGQGKTRGACAVLGIDACINQNLAAIVPKSGLHGWYLYYALVASYKELREFGRGGNQPALNCEIVGRIRIPVPPVDEQKELHKRLQVELAETAPVEKRILSEIALLREYRTRLIADIVTGKLDVREAAAHLPELAPEVADELDNSEPEEIIEDLAEEAA